MLASSWLAPPPPLPAEPDVGPSNLELYLRLDEDFAATLLPHQAARARQIAAEAEGDIAELLTGDQRQKLQEVGIRTLLTRVLYPGDAEAEFIRRLNGLPADAAADPGRKSRYRDFFCPKPFEHAEIGPGGKMCVCCPLMLPTPAGDRQSGTFMEVWNSERAQAIRQSILDGSYSYCIEQHCPDLQNGTLLRREQVQDPTHRDIIANNRTVLDTGPRTIVFGYDKSCNLACPTCRSEYSMVTGRARRSVEEIQDWATGGHLKDARRLDITLSGDAFGSPVYYAFLRNLDPSPYPELRITLCTNGSLFTPKNWSNICNEIVDFVYISIDAANEDTYALNRGGDFARLTENLQFVGELRSSGHLKEFVISFVVQENNYAEMPAFVSLGQAVHADKVMFIQLANTGALTKADYKLRAVHNPSHPKHGHFLEVLRHPTLGLPIVELRHLAGLRSGSLGDDAQSPGSYLEPGEDRARSAG